MNLLGKGDERGDAGGKDYEQQSDDHLAGGFWIILLPIPDDGQVTTIPYT